MSMTLTRKNHVGFRKFVHRIFLIRDGLREFFLRSLVSTVRKNRMILRYRGAPLDTAKRKINRTCLPRFDLHIIRPRLNTRHVAMCVLRVGRGHVRMAHLRTRVRMVRVMGGYVLDWRKGRLQLVVPDHLLSPVLPWRYLRDRLLWTVTLDRSLDLLFVSVE